MISIGNKNIMDKDIKDIKLTYCTVAIGYTFIGISFSITATYRIIVLFAMTSTRAFMIAVNFL